MMIAVLVVAATLIGALAANYAINVARRIRAIRRLDDIARRAKESVTSEDL